MRKNLLLTGATLLTGLLTCSATISPYGYWSFGTTGNPGLESVRNWGMTSYVGVGGPSDQGNALIVPNFGVGGPLGGTNGNANITSTSAVKTHALYSGNGGNIWVGNGSGWSLQYSNNWVLECWTLPTMDGTRNGYSLADIASIGEIQTDNSNGGASGAQRWGSWFRAVNGGTGSGIVYVQCMCAGTNLSDVPTNTFQLGPDVLVKNTDLDNRWIHLAAVRDNLAGTVSFYTNGVLCASTNADFVRQNPNPVPSTAFPGFGGAQGSPEYGGSTPYEGYIDDLRISSFADGQFSGTNLLTRAPGPSIVAQPKSITVWSGGTAPFQVIGAYDTSLTYQWYRGASAITGATSDLYVLPTVASGDNAAQFTCVLTDYTGISKTSSVATLTVVANNPSNVSLYQNIVKSEPSLIGYFPMDGGTANGVVTNVVDNTRLYDGLIEAGAFYDGGTNHAFGQQAIYFPGATLYAGANGDVVIPNNPAFEFGQGTPGAGFGSIEAVLYVDTTIANVLGNESPTWFAEQNGYYSLMANASSVLVGAVGNGTASWTVPGGLAGKFTHVAIVFDNDTNVTAYANGQSLGTQKIVNGFASYQVGNPFYIGWDGSSTQNNGSQLNLFHGSVDELAIYGTNLSAATLLDHYNKYFYGTNTSPASIVSVAPGNKTLWTGFPSQTLTVAVAGTPPYVYQWNSNGVPVAGATSSSYVVSGLAFGDYNYSVTVRGSVGAPTTSGPLLLTVRDPLPGYETAVATSSGGRPQAFWRLNEASGSLAADLAGTHDAKYYGGYLQAVPGAFANQYGVRFFGTNVANNAVGGSRVEAPFYSELNNPRGPISVEFWYIDYNVGNPNNSSAARYAISSETFYGNGPGQPGIFIGESVNVGAAWSAHGMAYGNSQPFRCLNMNQNYTKIVQGRWEHCVMTFDGDNGGDPSADGPGSGKLWVNGVLEGIDTGHPFHAFDGISRADRYCNNPSGPFVIGNSVCALKSTTANYARPFYGVFADVAVYNYALTDTDVSNHFFFAASPATITSEPVGATNTESYTASITLTVGVGGRPNAYQWYKDGVALATANNPDTSAHYPTAGNSVEWTQGPQSPKLVISQLRTNDTGNYQLVVSNPVQGTNSVVVHVQIDQDTTSALPVATGALGLGLTISAPVWNDMFQNGTYGPMFTTLPTPSLLKVTFNTRMDFVMATNPANYILSGGTGAETVTSVEMASDGADLLFGADGKTVSLIASGLRPGTNYILTVSNVKEQRSRGAAVTSTVYFTTPTWTPGTLCWDYYYKVPRSSGGNNQQRISSIATNSVGRQVPYVPQRELSITNFDTHQLGNPVSSSIVGNQGEDYVAVVSGWLTPTVTDDYQFWLAADDCATFWLNQDPITGSDPNGAAQFPAPGIAGANGNWNNPGFQVSALLNDGIYTPLVHLEAGKSYYMQAILQENGGGEWVAVGWKGSLETYTDNGGNPTNGIPSINVGSYSRGPTPKFDTTVISGGNATISWTGAGRLMQSTNVALPIYQWTPVAGNPTSPFVMTPSPAQPQMFYRIVQ